MKGAHDDSIMSLSMALYAGDMCFNQLQKSDSTNKAMLESWISSERTYEVNKSFYSYGTSLDPIGSMAMDGGANNIFHKNNDNRLPQEAYKEYSWLFGKSR